VAAVDLLGDASSNFQEGARDFAAMAGQHALVVADGHATKVVEEARAQG